MATRDVNATKAPIIYGVSSSMMGLAVLALAVRFWARLRTKTYLWWDDYLALAALPFALSINTLFIVTVTQGIGRHLSAIPNPAHSSQIAMTLDVAIQFIMCIGATLIKLSALAFYARVFRRTKNLRIALWVVRAATISYNIVEMISYCLRCGTFIKEDDPDKPLCLSASSAEIPNCTIDVVADLAILILPLPALAKLGLPWRKRLELSVVFVLGCGFTVITLLREIFAIQVMRDMLQFEKDPSWLVVPFNIAAVCEQPVGILTVSLPAAYPVLKDFGRRICDALSKAGQTFTRFTGYTNAPRGLRSFLPFPSLGSNFAVREEQFAAETQVVYYGASERSDSTGKLVDQKALKVPDKVHAVAQEVL